MDPMTNPAPRVVSEVLQSAMDEIDRALVDASVGKAYDALARLRIGKVRLEMDALREWLDAGAVCQREDHAGCTCWCDSCRGEWGAVKCALAS